MFIIQQLALCGWILHRLLKRSSDRAVNKLPLKKKSQIKIISRRGVDYFFPQCAHQLLIPNL